MNSNIKNRGGSSGVLEYQTGIAYDNDDGQIYVERSGLIHKLITSPSSTSFVPGEWEDLTTLFAVSAGTGIVISANTISAPSAHTQHTDTGTTTNTFVIGDGADTDKIIELDLGLGAGNPKLNYNTTTDRWEFSNDGSTLIEFGEVLNGENRFSYLSDSATTDQLFYRGQISGITDFQSDELSGATYETRLDTDPSFTPHVDLNAVDTWIIANITSTTSWVFKADALYKSGETGKASILIRYSVLL